MKGEETRMKEGKLNLTKEFLPEKKMVISYPLLARNPRPATETKYMTPVKIDINSPLEGKSFIRSQ